MDFILVWSLFVKVLFLFLAGFVGFKFLAYLDRRAGWNFKERLGGLTVPQALYFGMRILAVALVVSAVAGCSMASAFPTAYDRQIEKATKAYLPDTPWKLLKAQY